MRKHMLLTGDDQEIHSGRIGENAIIRISLTQQVNVGQELKMGAVCPQVLEAELFTPGGGLHLAIDSDLTLLLENEEDPVVFRGPILAQAILQFFNETNWGELDYLLIDCPPGTGDVPLTVFQSIPVDGIVIEGRSAVDESALTGESIPLDKEVGSSVSGATINRSGFIKCEAIKVSDDTLISQIIKMVSDAAATKAPIAKGAYAHAGRLMRIKRIATTAPAAKRATAGQDIIPA